ncbi:MAG: alcohol dehydrogenase catalytic domain-containing protein [Solirubrobacteraceae bacterium]
MGREFHGEVVEVGPRVTNVAVGDRVVARRLSAVARAGIAASANASPKVTDTAGMPVSVTAPEAHHRSVGYLILTSRSSPPR